MTAVVVLLTLTTVPAVVAGIWLAARQAAAARRLEASRVRVRARSGRRRV